MDGVPFTQYEQGESSLTLFNLPTECVLTIVTLLDPAANTALEGLYKSGDAYCTQCEAEGFRRITYYLDRPTFWPLQHPHHRRQIPVPFPPLQRQQGRQRRSG